MRIAIPVAGGKLAMHFGHCEQFALVDVNDESGDIDGTELVQAPEHQPGLLPEWLREKGVGVVIAGGMGSRAMSLFAQSGIVVAVGAAAESPQELARQFLAGSLKTGENVCDH
jgi:ATP-binding protein involved in chromosome partitioning